MREILKDLERWRRQGQRVAIARVVDLEGSGPRLPGASMAVTEDGQVAGSVSGGCVEGAVVVEALDMLATGCPLYTSDAADDPPRLDFGRRRSLIQNTINPYYYVATPYPHHNHHRD